MPVKRDKEGDCNLTTAASFKYLSMPYDSSENLRECYALKACALDGLLSWQHGKCPSTSAWIMPFRATPSQRAPLTGHLPPHPARTLPTDPVFILRGAFLVIGVILLGVSASIDHLGCQGSAGLPICVTLFGVVLTLDGLFVMLHVLTTRRQLAQQPGGLDGPSSNGMLADSGCAGKHFQGAQKYSLVATVVIVCCLVSLAKSPAAGAVWSPLVPSRTYISTLRICCLLSVSCPPLSCSSFPPLPASAIVCTPTQEVATISLLGHSRACHAEIVEAGMACVLIGVAIIFLLVILPCCAVMLDTGDRQPDRLPLNTGRGSTAGRMRSPSLENRWKNLTDDTWEEEERLAVERNARRASVAGSQPSAARGAVIGQDLENPGSEIALQESRI